MCVCMCICMYLCMCIHKPCLCYHSCFTTLFVCRPWGSWIGQSCLYWALLYIVYMVTGCMWILFRGLSYNMTSVNWKHLDWQLYCALLWCISWQWTLLSGLPVWCPSDASWWDQQICPSVDGGRFCVASAYWVLTERRILRRIFGPTKDRDGSRIIKTNNELNKLIRSKNIINYI